MLPSLSDYIIVEVDNACDVITTSSECEAAAQYLGLSDTSARSSNAGSYDPPYCYFEGGELRFNSAGTNTGACGAGSGQGYDQCLCKNPPAPTTTGDKQRLSQGGVGNDV